MPAAALLLLFVALGGLLAAIAGMAWGRPEIMRGWIAALQHLYGTAYDGPFLQRADAHVHMLTALLVAIWFGLLCRLFAPRTLPWLPLALAVMVALSDEILQLGSADRTFEWSDQLADAIGLCLAFPLLHLLARMRVGPRPVETRTPPSPPHPR